MSLPTSRDKIVHARLKVRRRRAPLPGADIDECDATRESTLLPTFLFYGGGEARQVYGLACTLIRYVPRSR